MPYPLINFELDPVEEIDPWGAPEDPNLHWFGLTSGRYWIQVGEERLFEYSLAELLPVRLPEVCAYQVARLYEDLTQRVPYALEPVPAVLAKYIALDVTLPWDHYRTKWGRALDDSRQIKLTSALLEEATAWIYSRSLDTSHLTPSANIQFWSDQAALHIQWDNREKHVDGRLAWSAQFGSWTLPRVQFCDELRSFHVRLMGRMEERISQVDSGAFEKRFRVDLEGLHREHQVRSRPIERNLSLPQPPTNWARVISAIHTIEGVTDT